MADLKIYKVNALPESPDPNAIYQVLTSGGRYRQFVTTTSGNPIEDGSQDIRDRNQQGGYPGIDSVAFRSTISDLRASQNIVSDSYYITDRNQQGVFNLVTGDTTTPDDGGVYIRTAGGYLFKRNYNGWVTPYFWGAIGDDVTDDTIPIQAAFNFSKSVFLPFGFKAYITDSITYSGFCRVTGESGCQIRSNFSDPTKPILKNSSTSTTIATVSNIRFQGQNY